MRRYYGQGYHDQKPSVLSLITAAVACVALAMSVFVIVGRRPAQQPTAGTKPGTGTAPTQPPAPTPTITPTIIPTVSKDPPANPGSKPKPVAAPRPPRAKACRNSYDPKCGRFFWSPAPAKDSPLRIDVEFHPRVDAGEEVRFVAIAQDGDASIDSIYASYGDGSFSPMPRCVTPERYGAWTPPERKADKQTSEFHHVYTKPGTYTAKFTAQSGDCNTSPYGGTVTIPVTIIVEAAS